MHEIFTLETQQKKSCRPRRGCGVRAAAVFLSLFVAAASLAGCTTSSSQGESAGSSTEAQPSSQGSEDGTDADSSGGTSGSAADSASMTGENAAEQELLVLPYDSPDPAQMESAYPWICSDLGDNADKLGGLTEQDDFHAAVNRDWLSSNSIPSGYISYDSFTERQEEVDEELQEILESDISFSDPYIAHCQKLVQDYYQMWLDWDARDAQGVEPLRKIVEPLLAVSSLEEMDDYLSDPLTVIEALPLCACSTAANLNDADQTAVYIIPPSLVFGDAMYYEYLDEDSWKTQPRYVSAAGYMLTRLGYSNRERDRILQDSYAFECEMAAHMMTTEENHSEDAAILSNNPRTLAELEEEQGDFPLTGMLRAAGVDHSEVFILEEPEWLECMRDIYNEEHLEKMKAYLLVSDVLQFMDLLDRDCYQQMIRVRNQLSGSTGQVDDKKAATDAVNDVLEMELGEVYAETYITDKTREDVTALTEEIIGHYRRMLQEEDFLSENTKAEAIKKLDNLTIRVASEEDHSEEDAALQKSGILQENSAAGGTAADGTGSPAGEDTVSLSAENAQEHILDFRGPEEGGSLVEARIAISRDVCLSIAENVNQPVDRSEWLAAPQDVNAYYYPLDNSINIPAGILGGVFYNDDMPYEEMLGHVGVIVGHEISHAFDTSGRQYDDRGNLRNWWTEEDYRQFHARAQKLYDYYCGFEPISGYKVNGGMIDTEAIADLTGVQCMMRIAAEKEDFDYDLFFRSFATNWRNLTTLETEAYSIEQDSHPLAYLRTNAVVVQFEEFHQTYGTQPGDGMYLAPEYRLQIW